MLLARRSTAPAPSSAGFGPARRTPAPSTALIRVEGAPFPLAPSTIPSGVARQATVRTNDPGLEDPPETVLFDVEADPVERPGRADGSVERGTTEGRCDARGPSADRDAGTQGSPYPPPERAPRSITSVLTSPVAPLGRTGFRSAICASPFPSTQRTVKVCRPGSNGQA